MATGTRTVSKSIDVNLNSRRKKGGTLMVLLRWEDIVGSNRGFGKSACPALWSNGRRAGRLHVLSFKTFWSDGSSGGLRLAEGSRQISHKRQAAKPYRETPSCPLN